MDDIARLIAIKTLFDIEEKKSFSNIKLNQYFKQYNPEPIDRAFATEILYGTLRWKLKIDYMIQKFSKLKLNKISPWVLSCIRTGVYQIYFMDKVPEFAAVNQAVELVKFKDKKAAPFVNGVLRNILRNRDEFYKIDVKDRIKKLSIEYSHPEWFVDKFIKLYGEDFVVALMEENNVPPGLTIRINTLKCKKEELVKLLTSKGIECIDGRLDESLVLKGFHSIEKSEEFIEGLFTIQDESSMLATRVLDPQTGDKVLDLCSAPGGKSTHMAQLMENKGEILSFDIHEHKLELVSKNAKRLGIDIIKTRLKDSTVFEEEYKDYADKVLLDAPCSGLGLIRKKPEIRWTVTQKDVIELQKIQMEIINNASNYVKREGTLVYSTCTISEEENEEIIQSFLENNENFKLESICKYIPEDIKKDDSCSKGYIKLFPNVHNLDGFFIAKLLRKW
ncbi:MAG: rsmB [Clostridiales bacterium]|jgi:16S rRNA (cytosine967-C5)-methyltransferase|nr:rsmB [Clostridiales bacterium]